MNNCVPDGVVERPHALQVEVHRDELELGVRLLHGEAQGPAWKGNFSDQIQHF